MMVLNWKNLVSERIKSELCGAGGVV